MNKIKQKGKMDYEIKKKKFLLYNSKLAIPNKYSMFS